ncbi:MAG: class I SAM-dependent methyltransferase [Ignavibacteria bacterium]|nr:class I SAM-dependent methyltransferase [Ignavibacteria bacterium]
MAQLAHDHPEVASAFDSLAGQYDALFGHNAISERLRQKIYSTIDFWVRPPAKILDINCGTGTDGIHLAEKGFSIVAVDLSSRMIAEANRKSQGLPNAQFLVASYENIDHIAANEFDLVLSNFGGLNCTQDLTKVGKQVAERLKPGGYFIAVVMPSFSFWETFSFAIRRDFKKAFRRLNRAGTVTQLNGISFTVYYYSPGQVARAFSAGFEVIETFGLNVFSPPPHAWKAAKRFPALTAGLEAIDDLLCRLPVLRSIGDHSVMVLRKRLQ